MGDYITATWGWDEQVERTFHDRAPNPHRWQIITAGQASIGMLDINCSVPAVCFSRLDVDPGRRRLEHRRRRMIRALLEEAERTGQDLVLDVLAVNRRAQALYRRLGLTEVASDGERGTKVTMRAARHRR